MDKYKYLPGSVQVRAFINDFLNYKKNINRDPKNIVEKYLDFIRSRQSKIDLDNVVEFTNKQYYSPKSFVSYVNDLIDKFGFDKDKIYNEFQEYRENIFKSYSPEKYKNIVKQKYPGLEKQKEKLEKQYSDILNINRNYIETNRIGNIINEINTLKQQMTDLNSKGIEYFKIPNETFTNLDYLLKKLTPQKPQLRVSQPDNYFSSFNPSSNYTLQKDYNTLSIGPKKTLQEDNKNLSIANKKLTDDYNTLSIAKNQLEEDNKKIKDDNEKMERLNKTLKNELDRLDKEFNDNIKKIMDEKNKQIEELKKKSKLAIGKGSEFEVNNKNLSDIDIQTDRAKQYNKNIQTALPSLYITDFRETYNQQGDYNKRVEAIQENANRKVEAIKRIYNQTKEDLIDEFNNLSNQLKEEYRNKKIRQNEYFEITAKEQPEDNNTTNKLVLTNNKVMADITPQMKLPPIRERITPPPETNTPPPPESTGKEEEDKPEDKPIEEEPTKDIVDDANIIEEEDKQEDKPIEEDKPEEKKEEKKVIPIENVGNELAKIIDSFYIQDKPIEETFSKLEETINNIPDEVFYTILPYVSGALANITVDGQKVFNDEAEVQQLLLKIKNSNKIHKRYKLPKPLEKAITQSNQRQLTISPMLLRNRKQTNINKNIYQY